ncbi:MAG: lysine biosynthesis protein LysW [Planctomycetota bacterium]
MSETANWQVTCPETGEVVTLEREPMVGEIVTTSQGIELEITSLDPLTVEIAPEVEEDWGE